MVCDRRRRVLFSLGRKKRVVEERGGRRRWDRGLRKFVSSMLLLPSLSLLPFPLNVSLRRIMMLGKCTAKWPSPPKWLCGREKGKDRCADDASPFQTVAICNVALFRGKCNAVQINFLPKPQRRLPRFPKQSCFRCVDRFGEREVGERERERERGEGGERQYQQLN